MNTGLDENETEFGILVFAVAFQMFSDGDGLLNEMVQVLWDFRGKTVALENTQDFGTRDTFDLSYAMTVSEDDTDLRRGHTLAGQLEYMFGNLLWSDLEPSRGGSFVG